MQKLTAFAKYKDEIKLIEKNKRFTFSNKITKMVRDDIVGGLKNAIERGSGLEKAKATFVNAGYNADEVDEAGKFVEMSDKVKKVIKENEKINVPVFKKESNEKMLPIIPKPKEKKKGDIRKVLIGLAILIFLTIIYLTKSMIGL